MLTLRLTVAVNGLWIFTFLTRGDKFLINVFIVFDSSDLCFVIKTHTHKNNVREKERKVEKCRPFGKNKNYYFLLIEFLVFEVDQLIIFPKDLFKY
jgi:hypothetical protein